MSARKAEVANTIILLKGQCLVFFGSLVSFAVHNSKSTLTFKQTKSNSTVLGISYKHVFLCINI